MSKPPPTLTPRRQHVLAGTARGHTRRQIARELGVCEGTVREDLRAIARILQAPRESRAGIVGRAYALGMLEDIPSERRPIVLLTPMQRSVLEGVARGMTNAQITARLYLTFESTRSYVRVLLAKFNAQDRAHLVALAIQSGHLRRSELARDVA